MSTPDLFKRHMASSSRDEKLYIEQEMRKRSVILDVKVDQTEDDDGADEVYAMIASSTFNRFGTGTQDVKAGGSTQFKMSVNKLWPMTNELIIDIFDYDYLSADDLIGTVKWPLPYQPTGEISLAAGTARYRASLQIA